MPYQNQRAFFAAYRDALRDDPVVVSEIEGALKEVHARYDTKVWENRFVAGGVTEQVVGSSARALGLDVANAGKQNQGYDLELPTGEGISIKAVFSSTNTQIRLINNLGSGTRAWADGTLFPVAGTGIGYADPELVQDATKQSGDALIISSGHLKRFWEDQPEWLIDFVDVPPKSDGTNSAVASDVIAFDLFQRYPRLMAAFRPEL